MHCDSWVSLAIAKHLLLSKIILVKNHCKKKKVKISQMNILKRLELTNGRSSPDTALTQFAKDV